MNFLGRLISRTRKRLVHLIKRNTLIKSLTPPQIVVQSIRLKLIPNPSSSWGFDGGRLAATLTFDLSTPQNQAWSKQRGTQADMWKDDLQCSSLRTAACPPLAHARGLTARARAFLIAGDAWNVSTCHIDSDGGRNKVMLPIHHPAKHDLHKDATKRAQGEEGGRGGGVSTNMHH